MTRADSRILNHRTPDAEAFKARGYLCFAGGRSFRYRRRGFTLIELMIVVFILALATAVVALNLTNLTSGHRLRADASTLGSRIDYLWDEAVSSGSVIYLVYDLSREPQAFWTYLPARIDESGVRHEAEALSPKVLYSDIKIKYILLPTAARITSGKFTIEFNPLRTEGTHIACLENEDGDIISVKANTYSGIVSYHEEELEFHEYTEN